MPKCLLYKMSDGRAIVGRFGDYYYRLLDEGKTEAQAAQMIAETDKPEGTLSWRLIDASMLPGWDAESGMYDRHYYSAFTDDYPGPQVDIDLDRAKELQKDYWRYARTALLSTLDVEARKASGNPEKLAEVDAKAQALRDVTDTDMSHITTVEELKNFWPEILGDMVFPQDK